MEGGLLYAIDLPNDQQATKLVHDCLETLSLKFSNERVMVDTSNSNSSRIWRVYGTRNCKGEASEDRPHRLAKLVDVPDQIKVVSLTLMQNLASGLPMRSRSSRGEQLDVARWITENNVSIVSEAVWKERGHKWIIQCPWNSSHDNDSAFIVQFPDGGIAAGCLHKSCRGNGWPRLRALYEQQTRGATPAKPNLQIEPPSKAATRTQTALLLELARDVKVFSTSSGDSYVGVKVGEHVENHRVQSSAFRQWLHQNYFVRTGIAPRPQVITEAVIHFDALARYDSPKEQVFIRIGSTEEINYLDLGDERWRSVEFSADGWRVVGRPSARFRRSPGMLPLPVPVTGGNINELRKFLNLKRNDDWILFVASLLSTLFAGPYPVLGLHGEAGSAKTTTSRLFRAMIDPNKSMSRAMPRDIRDLMVMVNSNWIISFDNLSFLPVWFSDAICRLSTGGGFSTRQLFTDSDEVVLEGQRPVVFNGIEELATRTDLLDRSVLLELPVIEKYRPERLFWPEFQMARPRLLGGLLDVAVEALRKMPSVKLAEQPRLVDFAVLATAAESALGVKSGGFMRAYDRNRATTTAVALEASTIADLTCKVAAQGVWEGTAASLLRKLSRMESPGALKDQSWPKTAKVLSGILRRLAPALRKAGVDVTFSRANTRMRTRIITIRARGD